MCQANVDRPDVPIKIYGKSFFSTLLIDYAIANDLATDAKSKSVTMGVRCAVL